MDTFRPKGLKVIDEQIERLSHQLEDISPVDPDYAVIADNLKRLTEARERKNPGEVNIDTLLSVAANIAGLLIVLNFEKTGIITSKAFNMLWKK